MKLLSTAARIAAACALICMAALAGAQQDYPVKPITLLIPFPPGTGNDVVDRIVGNKLTEFLGQRVVADNRAGASGNIAIDLARHAAPDGYTLVIASTSFSINLYTMEVNFGLADFTPVALIGKLPYTHMMFAPMVTSLPHYRSGKIQLHGVTGSKRSALMPDVPTFIEAGYPMLDVPTWFALLGPAGLPSGAVKVLSDSVAKVLTSKDVIDSLVTQGVEPGFGTPAELDAFLKADTAMWSRMVKEAGLKPQ